MERRETLHREHERRCLRAPPLGISAVLGVRDAALAGIDDRHLAGLVSAWRGALGRPALLTDRTGMQNTLIEQLVATLAPGFPPAKAALTIQLTRIMFPFILMVSLAVIAVLMTPGQTAVTPTSVSRNSSASTSLSPMTANFEVE